MAKCKVQVSPKSDYYRNQPRMTNGGLENIISREMDWPVIIGQLLVKANAFSKVCMCT